MKATEFTGWFAALFIWVIAVSLLYYLPMIARYMEVIMTDVAVIKSECGR